ncbi:hypothetical protein [Nocardiopsis alkaliphila]|uniref:hypothetical protein n=1 Tax=Nocardiopsis alkaliphila TaxID=225762 RepID=UPI00034777EE|nr:hypothetical protein [Nocardiopsis alkaliphila]
MSLTRWATAALTAVLVLVLAPVLTAAAPAVGPRGGPLDGFTIAHLPAQVGARTAPADFTYEWEDVSFTSRVWEQAKEGGGFQVVLQVLVLRGDKLTDLATAREFLTRYHERDPSTWELGEFDQGTVLGLYGRAEAFWTPEPGVVVEVRDASGLLGEEAMLATARGIVEGAPA